VFFPQQLCPRTTRDTTTTGLAAVDILTRRTDRCWWSVNVETIRDAELYTHTHTHSYKYSHLHTHTHTHTRTRIIYIYIQTHKQIPRFSTSSTASLNNPLTTEETSPLTHPNHQTTTGVAKLHPLRPSSSLLCCVQHRYILLYIYAGETLRKYNNSPCCACSLCLFVRRVWRARVCVCVCMCCCCCCYYLSNRFIENCIPSSYSCHHYIILCSITHSTTHLHTHTHIYVKLLFYTRT